MVFVIILYWNWFGFFFPADKKVTTEKPSAVFTDVTNTNHPQTQRPVQVTTPEPEETSKSKGEQMTKEEFVNKTYVETLQEEESVGVVAGIVIVILIVSGFTVFVVSSCGLWLCDLLTLCFIIK